MKLRVLVTTVIVLGLLSSSITNTDAMGPKPKKPVITVDNVTQTTIEVSWTQQTPPPVTEFRAEHKLKTGSLWTTDAILAPTIFNYNFTGLTPNTTYDIRIQACNANGCANSQKERTTLPADTTPPVITILGNNPETITVGDPYVDAGATALDDIDGDVTADIITTNNVDNLTIGIYTVDYEVSDNAGNTAMESRTVNVVASGGGASTKKGGGCDNCIAPTLGIQERTMKRMVSGGFTYNGYTVDAEYFRTPFPLIGTNAGENNTVTLKIYEDTGIKRIKHIAVAFGLNPISSFHDNKAYMEADIDFRGNVTLTVSGDITNVTTSSEIIPCGAVNTNCLAFSFHHTFTGDVSGVIGTWIWDTRLNSWQNFFNDGINVKYEEYIEIVETVEIVEENISQTSSTGGGAKRGTEAQYKQIEHEANRAQQMSEQMYRHIYNWRN